MALKIFLNLARIPFGHTHIILYKAGHVTDYCYTQEINWWPSSWFSTSWDCTISSESYCFINCFFMSVSKYTSLAFRNYSSFLFTYLQLASADQFADYSHSCHVNHIFIYSLIIHKVIIWFFSLNTKLFAHFTTVFYNYSLNTYSLQNGWGGQQ
jgi:hypothetical protein